MRPLAPGRRLATLLLCTAAASLLLALALRVLM